nr:hypothetical protein F21A10.3 - Caenorhabditis elegans [Caenorhabditis elegans]
MLHRKSDSLSREKERIARVLPFPAFASIAVALIFCVSSYFSPSSSLLSTPQSGKGARVCGQTKEHDICNESERVRDLEETTREKRASGWAEESDGTVETFYHTHIRHRGDWYEPKSDCASVYLLSKNHKHHSAPYFLN